MNIEYDLSPEKQFPHAVGQCFEAVKQFWSDASQLPVDTDRIAVAGESAGVFYAFYLAGAQDELLAEIGPLRYINKDVPRTLLMYGQMDAL